MDPDTLPRFGELAIRLKVCRQDAAVPRAEGVAVPGGGSICVLRCPVNGCLSPLNVMKLADAYHRDRSKFESSFHNIKPQKDDPFTKARVAAEWGFSSFPGQSAVQVGECVSNAIVRACDRACLRSCVPACLRACVPACLRARITARA